MTEIERAIAVTSNPSHWNDEAWNQGAIEAARNLALAALREKAEREKGCEACGLIYKLDGAAYGTVDELIDNTFCPMCGKKLEEHHETD